MKGLSDRANLWLSEPFRSLFIVEPNGSPKIEMELHYGKFSTTCALDERSVRFSAVNLIEETFWNMVAELEVAAKKEAQ